ncbi:unnamed protein product, partial [Iphiclides podalirius]
MATKWDNDEDLLRLREYLRIRSVHPDIDYYDCVKFLKQQADSLGLSVNVSEPVERKPVVVITWQGTQPDLPAILLNSHMDVVPVYEENWKYPPFEAHVTDDGWIYSRGVQDMKSVGMMHLEAVRRLKQAGVKLKRTVHISFVPDEEIGGTEGMKAFSESQEFLKLNVGFALDESIPSDSPNTFIAHNGERTGRQIKITCKGEPAHGALIVSATAGEKIHYIISKFMELREREKKKYESGAQLGDVTTINLTQLGGGIQVNVLPEQLSVSFDIRISPHEDHDAFENMILDWCKEAGDNVTMEYYVKNPQVKSTDIGERSNFWKAVHKTVVGMGLGIECVICPGVTDARYVRLRGIPVIGFSPLLNTPLLLHAHNERVHVDEFKRGIDVMEEVVKAVANV